MRWTLFTFLFFLVTCSHYSCIVQYITCQYTYKIVSLVACWFDIILRVPSVALSGTKITLREQACHQRSLQRYGRLFFCCCCLSKLINLECAPFPRRSRKLKYNRYQMKPAKKSALYN